MFNTFGLFLVTAFFEILGCYSMLLYSKSTTVFAAAGYFASGLTSLLMFAFLLTYHPTDSGRVYATYGGVYVFASLLWLMHVDNVTPTPSDIVGVGLVLIGVFVIGTQYLSIE